MKIGRIIIRIVDNGISIMITMVFVICLLFGAYSIWDLWNIDEHADKKIYKAYCPGEDEDLPFEQLKSMNPDVFGWVQIKGTGIDYPLVQGTDNHHYVNTDAKGDFALSGSIFLDYRNQKDFSDVSSIIYGHHMKSGKMFGDLEKFCGKSYFKKHKTGRIYYNERWHKMKVAAFLRVDAHDPVIYDPTVSEAEKEAYLAYIEKQAKYVRQVEFSNAGHIIVFSTCMSDGTDGRYVLVGVIEEKREG